MQPQLRMQQQPQQNQLDKSIENTRRIMQQFAMMSNKEQAMMNLLQNNPQFAQIASLAAKSGNLQSFAQQMAAQEGVNINDIINKLLQK